MEEGLIDAYLAVTLTPGFSPRATRLLFDALGGPRGLMEASPEAMAAAAPITLPRATAAAAALREVARSDKVARERGLMAEHGVSLVTMQDAEYPYLLRQIDDPPPVLYVRGKLPAGSAALAVVGSRRCSIYGREQADRFASMLAQAGLTIVSGGARGIDAAAHHAAVRVRGQTIAVLGSGLANPYPSDNRPLFDQIVREGLGAVASELPMQTPPARENFPARNRIVSGLAAGVLVVEAPVRSGSLITARLACDDQNRDVFAIPGPVDRDHSSGCHHLIRMGSAELVTTPGQLLESLGELSQRLPVAGAPEPGLFPEPSAPPAAMPPMPETHRRVLEALERPMDFDQLVAGTGLDASQLRAQITLMEVRGLIRRRSGRIEKLRFG